MQPIIEGLKQKIPQYHMRAMQRETYAKFGPVTANPKKNRIATSVCKDFVCDSTAPSNLSEAEIDSRVSLRLLVHDLRHQLAGRQAKFDTF